MRGSRDDINGMHDVIILMCATRQMWLLSHFLCLLSFLLSYLLPRLSFLLFFSSFLLPSVPSTSSPLYYSLYSFFLLSSLLLLCVLPPLLFSPSLCSSFFLSFCNPYSSSPLLRLSSSSFFSSPMISPFLSYVTPSSHLFTYIPSSYPSTSLFYSPTIFYFTTLLLTSLLPPLLSCSYSFSVPPHRSSFIPPPPSPPPPPPPPPSRTEYHDILVTK